MPRDTGEHNMILDYVTKAGGRTYFEVPIGGGASSSLRRLDAVRVAAPGAAEYMGFNSEMFLEDLRVATVTGHEVELIEAKRRLNRPVIGEIIAGGDLFCERFPDHGPIRLAVVVGRDGDDAALHRVCDRRGIRVHLREWRAGQQPSATS